MKVDGGFGMGTADMASAAKAAAGLEAAGYDGVWSAETSHDPFFPLLLAAEHTSHLELGTGIAVAFARNPMTMANIGNDLQLYSGGRFLLGLGSQIKPHITKRFSMSWSHPAPRMREFVLAMRAIWDCWNSESDPGSLRFEGEYYQHTLMTPFFNPGPNPYGPPRVFLAAVGQLMTEVAGEVADGMLVHAFTTPSYVSDVTLPALERGFARAGGGKSRASFQLSIPAFVVTGADEEAMANAARGVREQIAFYGSTPAYRGVLEHHGWGDLQPELNRLSKQGAWQEMGELIPDDVLHEFAVVGSPSELPRLLLDRWGPVVDRLSFYAPYGIDPDTWAAMLVELKAG